MHSFIKGCCLTTMLVMGTAFASEASPDKQVTAQWHDYELRFRFSSFHTYYSCSSLDNKLENILKKLGAKPDVKVVTTGCSGQHDVGNMLSSRIKVSLPVAAPAGDQTFPASYRPVKLKTNEWGEMSSGDCELLEEVGKHLLPQLHLTVSDNQVRCIPGQAVINNQSMTVKALVALLAKP